MNFRTLFIFLFITTFCYSQNTIKGKIINNESNPVEYAVIYLQNKDSINIKTELSDENGLFTLKEVTNGSYKLIIQYFSENIYTQNIDVTSNIDLNVITTNTVTSLNEITLIENLKIKKELGKYIVTNISSSPLSKNKDSYDFLGTIPLINNSADGNSINIKNKKATVEHEATTSKIGEDILFYCQQRGISEEDAVALIVNGYAKEVLNQLPMEFAVEAQKLLAISLEGSVG